MKNKILAVISMIYLGLTLACAGGANGGGDGGHVTVSVSPSSATVIAGQTQKFAATVTGALNSAVAWNVTCSGSSCGTIDSTGLYTAPALIPADASVTVRAVSQEDTNIAGTATISQKAVVVAISPNSSATLISADTKQFATTVSNAPEGHATFTWSVSGGGSVDANGLYSAPAKVTTDATVTVTATSDFDTTKKSSVTLNLKAPVVSLSPTDMVMEAGGQQLFTPTVSYVPAGQSGVTWNLTGPGSIASGLFSAPTLVTTHQSTIIRATSVFDNTKSAQIVVTMDPIVIGVSPKTATLYPQQTRQFAATLANHINKSVTWSVTGTSCGGGACGTISSNGLYTAPSSISSEFTVSVVVTSVADVSKSDSAVLTLKPITVTVSPESASVKVGTAQQFNATVLGGTNTSVTWTLSGAGCSGSTCGTIDASGLYTAPANVPTPATVTVKGTAVADPTRFDTATVTVIYDPNIKLNGGYAFTFTGWDASGRPMDWIGRMVADGNGHITGLIDANGATYGNHNYFSIQKTLTGTYQVNATDNRGAMTLSYQSTLGTESFELRFAIDSTGSRGHFMLFEPYGRYGSGTFKRQTSSDFSLAKLNGDYAIGMAGLSFFGDERNAVVGRGHLDGAGGVSNTSLDLVNTGGSALNVSYAGAVAMNAGTGMSSGRGTMSLSALGQTLHFSFYMVDSTEMYVMASDQFSDSVPAYIGRILKQSKASFSAADFSGRAVMYMTGINTDVLVYSSVFIGAADLSTGQGNYAFVFGGTHFADGNFYISSAVSANGRTLLSLGFVGSWVAYLVAPNTGFIMQYDAPGTMILFGFFEPQSDAPIGLSTLNGEFFGGAVDSGVSNVGFGNGIQNWNGNGAWSGTGNTVGGGSGLQPDVPVAGTYTITDTSTGYGRWLLTSPGTYNKRFYVISPNKIVFIPWENSNVYPSLEIFEK